MASPKKLRKDENLARLASLLSEESWKALSAELHLKPGTDRIAVLHDPKLISDKISGTRLLSLVLDEYGAAMSMLADVTEFLERHQLTPRATGSIAVLPGIEKLRPQQRALLSSWNRAAHERWRQRNAIETLWSCAQNELNELLRAARDARPPRYKDKWGLGVYMRVDAPDRYHAPVLELLRRQIALIQGSLPESELDRPLRDIQYVCLSFLRECDAIEEGEESALVQDCDEMPSTDRIAIFLEQLKLLGRLQSAEDGLADLLEVGLFRNIPQLFEVWLLCFVLNTLRETGYAVEILQTFKKDGQNHWYLKFAAAGKPVAKIGSCAWLFFQYKAPGKSVMPDLAIYDNPTADGTALLVIDAKCSELLGYTAANYLETLSKYGALGKRCIIAEHAQRADIAAHSDIVLHVAPESPGADGIRAALFGAMTSSRSPALAAIDCSSSFLKYRDNAARPLEQWVANGLIKDEFLTFASSAEMNAGLSRLMGSTRWPPMDGTSTRLKPLKEKIAAFRVQSPPLTVLLMTDGDFCDGDAKELLEVCDLLWVFGAPRK